VLSKISGILAQYKISLSSVIQKAGYPPDKVPIVMMTYDAPEHAMQQALAKIDQLDIVTDKTVLIRVL
jgi:homoserine dehydrogenase